MKDIMKLFTLVFLLSSCSHVTMLDRLGISTNDSSTQQQALASEEVVKKVPKPSNEVVISTPVVKPVKKAPFNYVKNSKAVEAYCDKINTKFRIYGWGKSRCNSFSWHHVRDSVLGDPLMWVTYGDENKLKEESQKQNVTLVMCGVHGDEITPVKFCFDVLKYLHNIEVNNDGQRNFNDNLVVVVPIVNPDSFFRKYPTRTNQRGVDINRNLPTKDWHAKARRVWKRRYRSDKRRNPGIKPMSEPETLFQVNLLKRYEPNRIISVHAPLTILDYDGPELANAHINPVAKHANHVLVQMSKKAKGYRIKNYPFFPGSLGNYAGNERNIPTYTLELPSSDNRNHKKYWKMFKGSIDYALFNGDTGASKVVINQKNSRDLNAPKVKSDSVQKSN